MTTGRGCLRVLTASWAWHVKATRRGLLRLCAQRCIPDGLHEGTPSPRPAQAHRHKASAQGRLARSCDARQAGRCRHAQRLGLAMTAHDALPPAGNDGDQWLVPRVLCREFRTHRLSRPTAQCSTGDAVSLSATLTLGDVLSLGLHLAENFRRNPRARDPCSRDFRTITCLREAPFTPQ